MRYALKTSGKKIRLFFIEVIVIPIKAQHNILIAINQYFPVIIPNTDNLTDTNELRGITIGNTNVINIFINVIIADIVSILIGKYLLAIFILTPSLRRNPNSLFLHRYC